MASLRTHIWQRGDDLWHIAGQRLLESGYADTSTFVRFIWAANPTIQRWWDVQPGTRIVLPYFSS